MKKDTKMSKCWIRGARGFFNHIAERGIGDVLLSWENEALLATQGLKDKYDIVYPSISILAEPSVAIVDKTVDKMVTAIWRAVI